MSQKKIARPYAIALFGLAQSDKSIDQIYQDMHTVLEVLATSRELCVAIESPVVQYYKKKAIIQEVFGGSVQPLMLNFLLLLAEKRRESSIYEIALAFFDLYNELNSLLPMTIISAVELDEATRLSVVRTMEQKTGKKALASFEVDSRIRGGLIVQFADSVIDGSVRHHLQKLYRELAGAEMPPWLQKEIAA